MTKLKTVAAFVVLLAVCGCKVGPNYKRPATTVPDQYRGAPTPAARGRAIWRHEVVGGVSGRSPAESH